MSHTNALRIAFGFGLILAALLASSAVAWKFGHPPELGDPWRGWFYSPLAAWGWWQDWGSQEEYRKTFLQALSLCLVAMVTPPMVLRMVELNSPLRIGKPDPVAGFGTVKRLLKSKRIFRRGDGVVIGKGGWRTILRDRGDGHVLIMGPSRLGKGAGHVVPTLLSHSGSMLVFDPKHELAAITGRRRCEFGTVAIFDPTSAYTAKFNPLLELRSGARLIGDCQMVGGILAYQSQQSSDPFWHEAAENLVTALVAHARVSDDPTLAHVWRLLLAIRCDRYPRGTSGYAKELLDGHREIASKTRQSINEQLLVHLRFLADPLIQEATGGNDFRASDLQANDEPFTLFLTIPVSQGKRLRPLTRVLVETIVATLTDDINLTADRRLKQRPVLALLDEFPQLGKLDAIGEKMKIMASYKVRCCLVCQSEEDIVGAYGSHQTITDNCSTICAIPGFGVASLQALARRGGRHAVAQSSKQIGGGVRASSNLGQSENMRDLLDAGNMIVRSRDEVLVFTSGCQPTWLDKVRYWKEAEYRNGWDTHSARPEPERVVTSPERVVTSAPIETEIAAGLTEDEAALVDDLEDLLCQAPEAVRKRVQERMAADG